MYEKSPENTLERFPDEDLPEGSVVDVASLTHDLDEVFDFVVIGSGAGGAVAAHTLAVAGYSVAIVEEGPWVKTRDFGEDVNTAFGTMMRDSAMQVITGRAYIPLLQGRCVGGSTVMNSAIAWRTPEDVIDDWGARFGLAESITMKTLDPHFDALERDLNVRAVGDDALGENNRLFIEHGKAIGATAMRRYDAGCKGASRCLTGCPNAAKQGMSVSYVPWALALGARIFTSCRADRVDIRAGRAVGVVARGIASGVNVRLRARRGVFVAASTIQTPNVLWRSGIRARALGRHFQAHPGLALAAIMERRVDMTLGATQGAESIHYRGDRFKLETLSMPPALAAARIPGVGSELSARMASFSDAAVWAAQIRARAEGTVRPGWGGKDRVRYTMTEEDMRATRKASAVIARLMFDAGAREVWPGIHGVPSVIRVADDVRLIDDGPLDPRAYGFIASHLFGAARMGADPRSAVVRPDFVTHEAEALYVVDSSIFPTNLGVNPQHSIMALSRLAATRVADGPRRVAVA